MPRAALYSTGGLQQAASHQGRSKKYKYSSCGLKGCKAYLVECAARSLQLHENKFHQLAGVTN